MEKSPDEIARGLGGCMASSLYGAQHNTFYKVFLNEGINHNDRKCGNHSSCHTNTVRSYCNTAFALDIA